MASLPLTTDELMTNDHVRGTAEASRTGRREVDVSAVPFYRK